MVKRYLDLVFRVDIFDRRQMNEIDIVIAKQIAGHWFALKIADAGHNVRLVVPCQDHSRFKELAFELVFYLFEKLVIFLHPVSGVLRSELDGGNVELHESGFPETMLVRDCVIIPILTNTDLPSEFLDDTFWNAPLKRYDQIGELVEILLASGRREEMEHGAIAFTLRDLPVE